MNLLRLFERGTTGSLDNVDTLHRPPQTSARRYRRASARDVGLRSLETFSLKDGVGLIP